MYIYLFYRGERGKNRGCEMRLLEERILRDGIVCPGNILKVDSFLNHQIDVSFLNELGREFARLYAGERITKILTVEASGIGIACITAQYFGVPVVFAKKTQSLNISGDVYSAKVESFTRKKVYDIVVSRNYLNPGDRVLLIDDFLAAGNALRGLIELVHSAGAEIAGAGIVVEKGFQGGGDMIRSMGVRVESLAVIKEMDDEKVIFA